MRAVRPFAVAVLTSLVVSGQAPAIDPAAIARQIETELAAARVPGAAIAVVAGGRHHAGAFGVDAERKTALTPSTLLQAGSVSKVVTALATTAALDARGLPLDTPVGRHMPGLAPAVGALTFHHLLSQTSGLGDRAGEAGSDDEGALAASARQLSTGDFVLPAGTVFSYSNPGYALAGAALESLTKQPFADALRAGVLLPLGMTASTIRPAEVRTQAYAVGHRLEGDRLVTVAPVNDTRLWPAGYLWTNAEDLTRALTALVDKGRVAGEAGLAPAIVERVTAAQAEMPNVFVGGHYGYGLMIARDRGALVHEHGGTMPGFSAIVRTAPEHRLGLAILTNLEGAPIRRVAQLALAAALRLPDAPPVSRPESPVAADDVRPLLGTYRNRGTAELAVRDSQVVLILDGGPPLAVSGLGGRRYIARAKPGAPGPEFVLQPATGAAPAYLHFALWAYRREGG